MFFFVLGCLTAIAGQFIKRSKVLACVQISCMLLLSLPNYNNSDYYMFSTQYNHPKLGITYGASEIGYNSLMSVFRFLGFPFIYFRDFFIIFGLLFSVLTIRNITDDISAVLGLFFFVPFIISITQYRFFFASSICAFAISILLSNCKYSKISFFTLVLFGSLFHNSCIFYFFFFVIVLLKKIKNLRLVCVAFTFALICLIPTGLIQFVLEKTTDSARATAYFGKTQHLGVLQGWILLLSFVFILLLSLKAYGFGIGDKILLPSEYVWADYIRRFNYCCLPILVLLVFDLSSCFRLFRGVLILEYSFYYLIRDSFKKHIVNKSVCWIFDFLFYASVGLTFWSLTTMHNVNNWLYPIFDYNYLLS